MKNWKQIDHYRIFNLLYKNEKKFTLFLKEKERVLKSWKHKELVLPIGEIVDGIQRFFEKYVVIILTLLLTVISICCFILFYKNGLGLSYNDARSHLDIGRRVVEGLKPGLAQLGSVWLPLPHLLMVPTIWNDFMWHSGLSGALQSMISFIATGVIIYLFLKKIGVQMVGRLIGVLIFVANWNILYLQSTAMTELLLIASMTASVYYLLLWQEKQDVLNLIKTAFWIMCATLNRYDGWFLLGFVTIIVGVLTMKKRGIKATEGTIIFFLTLASVGIGLWFLWNLLIFKDPLYFLFGPYSAHTQQLQLAGAGDLPTEKNLFLSMKDYYYALSYNMGMLTIIISVIGVVIFYLDKKIRGDIKIVSLALFVPLIFNILALYLGFSVLYVQGISGSSWFNVRYGVLMAPTIAIFIGYLIGKVKNFRPLLIGLIIFFLFFSLASADAVTIDDARVGSSQVNVSQVSNWIYLHAKNEKGFILIAAASHDAIIFSSHLPMSRFIHEGTGQYWIDATKSPDRWARWIIMRTNDMSDQTYKLVHKTAGFKKYQLVGHYPFADIYEIKPQYVKYLNTSPILGKQK